MIKGFEAHGFEPATEGNGVLECWSNGVKANSKQIKSIEFSFYPTLHYSNTPSLLLAAAEEAVPG